MKQLLQLRTLCKTENMSKRSVQAAHLRGDGVVREGTDRATIPELTGLSGTSDLTSGDSTVRGHARVLEEQDMLI